MGSGRTLALARPSLAFASVFREVGLGLPHAGLGPPCQLLSVFGKRFRFDAGFFDEPIEAGAPIVNIVPVNRHSGTLTTSILQKNRRTSPAERLLSKEGCSPSSNCGDPAVNCADADTI